MQVEVLELRLEEQLAQLALRARQTGYFSNQFLPVEDWSSSSNPKPEALVAMAVANPSQLALAVLVEPLDLIPAQSVQSSSVHHQLAYRLAESPCADDV